MYDVRQPRGALHSEETAASSRRKRILVVDDQIEQRLLIARFLTAHGYEALVAESGADALTIVRESAPDLVLLDVMMPGMDGFTVCRRIKSDPRSLLIPIVLVTALESKQDRIRGLKAGADEFLSKPVNREELIVRVRALLRYREVRDRLEDQHMQSLKQAISRYFSPRLVDRILESPEAADQALADRQQRVGAAVLFADLRGFTAISEQIAPERVVALLNEFFTELTSVAHEYEGTIFNMAGDSLLVGFGVPFEQADASDRAIACALAMHTAFARASTSWPSRFGVQGGLGIGVNYGDVIAGNVGSPNYMSYTIIGDAVNVAARLTARAGDGEIYVSQSLLDRVCEIKSRFDFVRLEPIQLKGKSELQQAFKIVTCDTVEAASRQALS